MTPQQEAFEAQLTQSPLITEMQGTDEKLLKGQNSIQEHLSEVDERLEDGSKVMKGLIEDVKEVFNFMNSQAHRQEQMHQETKEALKDHKYQDMKEENKALKTKFEDEKKRRWDIVKMILSGIIGTAFGGLGLYLFGG